MPLEFAGISLLDNPYHIDGVYDYRIPPELMGEVRAGMFVTVPFGTANRTALGLCVECKESSAYKDVKQIKTLCPEHISLDEEMLGLCSFMKMRTLCTTGDAARAMVPAASLSRLSVRYTPSAEVPATAPALTREDPAVYEFVRERGGSTADALRSRFGSAVEKSLSRLVSRGYLVRTVELKDSTDGPVERFWRLAVSEENARLLMHGMSVGSLRLPSPKQRAIVERLLYEEEPLSTDALGDAVEATPAQLKNLQSKGVLACEERRIDRNPYAKLSVKVTAEPPTLNEEQSAALETLSTLAFSGEPKAALLHGVTGSGKTAVMMALIDRLLKAGRGAIVLLPEIALTPQSVSLFCARFGGRVAVIHSGLSAGERYDAYRRIRTGDADVVLGTRSAVFAPVKNLGAIIIDEEQEHTYKSDQNPKYHARDIARYRCNHHRALMLLASATPSLESYHKAKEGIYTLITLKNRFGGASLPRVHIADMRHEVQNANLSPLGEDLLRELSLTLSQKEQAVLFLNRRGYNHYVSCRSCGEAITCPGCSVAMTYHTRRHSYSEGELVCHWCGRRMPLPTTCPNCSSEHLLRMGFGTQRVEEELETLFPASRILRMDTDTTGSKFAYDELLGEFRRHEADVLLGTQMVTKGHDFSDVTLVGVLLADASLYLDDYRASERTFAMLTQVIGRAGRSGDKPGLAVIQTSNPDHEVIRLAAMQDYEGFYEREIRLRKLLVFPPFCDMVLLGVTGISESEVAQATTVLSETLRAFLSGEYSDVPSVVFGPFEAPVYRVDHRYRMRLIVKCRLNRRAYALFSELLCKFGTLGKKTQVSVDFNPSGL